MNVRVLAACCVVGALHVGPAAAQAPPSLSDLQPHPGFLLRYQLLASIEALSDHADGYYWDADVTAEVDAVDFGRGRVTVVFNYEAVMGNDLQPFDPVQSNYTLDVVGGLRRGRTEWDVLFRHVSRHLGDREKDFGIAWNDMGLRLVHVRAAGPWQWQVRAHALATVARSYVDYRGDAGGDLVFRRQLSTAASVIGGVVGHVRFVRAGPLDRDAQAGGHAELGVRFDGVAAALELVGGAERRVDADVLAFGPRQWAFVGIRIVTR